MNSPGRHLIAARQLKPTRHGPSLRRTLLLLSILIAGAPSALAAPQSEATTATAPRTVAVPLSLRPYLVRVEFSIRSDSDLSPADDTRMLQDATAAVNRMFGPMWSATVVMSEWLLPGTSQRLQRVTATELTSRYPAGTVEKLMLISIEPDRGGWTVACREYDARVQELTPVRMATTWDPRELSSISARLMRDCFRPVLMLAHPAKDTDILEFDLQAGELPPSDPSAAQIAEGDVLRPFLRHMERREPDKLKQLQRLDLTYIRVTDFNEQLTPKGLAGDDAQITADGATPDDTAVYQDRGRVRGVLISHGLAPFGGRGRNVEQLALRQRPQTHSSRVQLVLNQRPDRPLVCHRVDRVNKLRWRDESSQPAERMVSGRNGEIEIAVDPKNPTVWLYVYSGGLLLARVPYAPGLLEFDTVRLQDDSIRLGVEGELYLFRDQLVDVVAQRAVLKSMARKAAAAGDLAGLENAIKGLDTLPGEKEFTTQLNAVRVPAIDRAKELKDRRAELAVGKLCDAMSKSLAAFFQTDKQIREMEEIQQLRALGKVDRSQ